MFEVLETPLPPRGRLTEIPDLSTAAISIDQVTVIYPRRDRPALERVSLEIDPGECVAVAGPSGSGKSTLVSVLLGFVVPDSGAVRIGTRPLSELDPDAWRRRIAWLPQQPHLFAGSFADNVRMSRPDATEERVWQAIEAAGLGDVVRRRPGGLDARVAERGRGISAGERRRLALARVFLRDAPLLLLDEPTANLDADTEEQVVAAIRRLMESRTVIVATHSAVVWNLADRVVELGRVAVAA
jgi:ABC-type multidrug transport system fused ATPase/permease subunit